MESPEVHPTSDWIGDGWLEDFAGEGVAALEKLLALYARFDAFLAERGLA